MTTFKLTYYRDRMRRKFFSRKEHKRNMFKWILCRINCTTSHNEFFRKFNFDRYSPVHEADKKYRRLGFSVLRIDPSLVFDTSEYQKELIFMEKLSKLNSVKCQLLFFCMRKMPLYFMSKNIQLSRKSMHLHMHKLFVKQSNFITKKNFFIYNLNLVIYNFFTFAKANHSRTRIRNFCPITGQFSAILRIFKLSRRSFINEIKKTQRYVGVQNALYTKGSSTYRPLQKKKIK